MQSWRTPFPILNQSIVPCPILTVPSWPAYNFLRRQVKWSGIPISKNLAQFVVIHTVKSFSVVNEADVFLQFLCFFYVGNLISGSSAISKSSLYIWKFLVHILLKPNLKDFEYYLASMWDECNCIVVWTFFGDAFPWDWNENWPFSSPVANTELVMLPKAQLTSHSRMSGSKWVITPLWLSRSLRPFLHSSSVYSCYLLLISSAFIRSFPFLSFIRPILAWNVPLILSVFLKRSLVFPVLLFSSISLHCSLRKAFLSLLAIVWNDAFNCIYLSFSPLLLFLSQLFLAGVFLNTKHSHHFPRYIGPDLGRGGL